MINNLDQIKELLDFQSEDDFYFLQILKRKKEHPDLGSNSMVIKTYYIRSSEHLVKIMDEIKLLCDHQNARAYINLNVRSFEKTAFHTLKKISDIIMNRDYKSVKDAYDSSCGSYSAGRDKSWVLDFDEKNPQKLGHIVEHISKLEPIGEKCIALLETRNGYHIISKPFNLSKFDYSDIDIHKNNPTILYIP